MFINPGCGCPSAGINFFRIILEYIGMLEIFDDDTASPRPKTSYNKPSISGCLHTRKLQYNLTVNLQCHHRIKTYIRRRTHAISYTPVSMSSRRTTGVICHGYSAILNESIQDAHLRPASKGGCPFTRCMGSREFATRCPLIRSAGLKEFIRGRSLSPAFAALLMSFSWDREYTS